MKFSTGQDQFDQGMNTLLSGIIPDQSKVAQGYYYGSEARKAQLEGASIQDKLAASNANLAQLFGQSVTPQFGPGPLGVTIMTGHTINPPLAGGPAPNPALAAPVVGATPLTSLADTVAGMTPGQVGQGIVAGVENNTGVSSTATPSPMNVQPGSVTSAGGGGIVKAPPAANNGSPSPIGFNFAQYYGMGMKAGYTVDQLRGGAQGVIADLMAKGQLAEPLANRLLAANGQAALAQQEIQNRGSLAVAQTGAAAEIQKQAMVNAQKNMEFWNTFEQTRDANGMPVYTPRSRAAGMTAYNPQVETQRVALAGAPVMVQPGGPGTPAYQEPASQAQANRSRLYETQPAATLAAEQEKVGNYMDTSTGIVAPMTAREAIAKGFPAAATTPDGVMAQAGQVLMSPGVSPQRKQEIQQGIAAFNASKPLTDKEQFDRDQLMSKRIANAYAAKQSGKVPLVSTEPAFLGQPEQAAIDTKIAELALRPENASIRTNYWRLFDKALQILQSKEGDGSGNRLPTQAEINAMRQKDWRGRLTSLGTVGDDRLEEYTPPGGQPGSYFRIRLTPVDTDPVTGRPWQQNQPAATPAPTPPAPTPAPPPTSAAPQPQRVAPAPAPAPAPAGPGGSMRGAALVPGQTGAIPEPAAPNLGSIFNVLPTRQNINRLGAGVRSFLGAGADLGPAPQGATEGQTSYDPQTGKTYVVRGGRVVEGR